MTLSAVVLSQDLLPRILCHLQLAALRVVGVCREWHDAVVELRLTQMALAGANVSGQLCVGTTRNLKSLHRAMPPDGSSIANVSCGFYHTCVVTASGELWTSGRNNDGQLGLGHTTLRLATLQRVALPACHAVVQLVACGAQHTMAVTACGALWGCGSNEFGQLALGDVRSTATLERVSLPLEMMLITDIACGQHHTAMVTADGRAWSCGIGPVGQLGAPNRPISSALQRMMFNLVDVDDVDVPVSVSCGKANTFLRTSSGQLWACGWNSDRRAGVEPAEQCRTHRSNGSNGSNVITCRTN